MGCVTLTKNTLYLPQKPTIFPTSFTKTTDGYFINDNDAKILADNIDEIKAYEQKMELLVYKLARSYNIKLEEQEIE